jgi:hypothetical protein
MNMWDGGTREGRTAVSNKMNVAFSIFTNLLTFRICVNNKGKSGQHYAVFNIPVKSDLAGAWLERMVYFAWQL